MATVKDWIVQSRTHTAALTIAGTLLAVRLSAPDTTWQTYLAFTVLAFILHGVGFSVNNALDLDPWDRADPAKQHHPLVAGRIRERDLWAAIVVGTATFSILGAYLAHANPWSLLALFGFAFFGTLYNHQCKVSLWGPIWISLSFACIPLYAWLAVGPPAPTLWFIVSYAFLLMLAQISIEGWWKDLGCKGEVNLLRRLGASVTTVGVYHTPTIVGLGAWGLRLATGLLAAIWVATTGAPWWLIAAVILLGSVAATAMGNVVRPGKRTKRQVLASMGVAEILVYWVLVLALAPSLGAWWTLGLVFGPVAYYVATNLFFWGKGHALGPAV